MLFNGAPFAVDSISGLKFRLLYFLQLKIVYFEQNKTFFILDKCCHLVLCYNLREPNWLYIDSPTDDLLVQEMKQIIPFRYAYSSLEAALGTIFLNF